MRVPHTTGGGAPPPLSPTPSPFLTRPPRSRHVFLNYRNDFRGAVILALGPALAGEAR